MRSSTVAEVRDGAVEMAWDASARVASIRFSLCARLGRRDGLLIVQSLSGWIGNGGDAFGLLVDGRDVGGADAEYRAVVGAFFREHRTAIHMACFNLSALVRVIVEMFRVGTGAQVVVMADEEGARSWLRGRGLGA